MSDILTRISSIFYPIFEDDVFVFKEIFSENYIFMYGYYSREGYKIMAGVWYSKYNSFKDQFCYLFFVFFFQ